MAQWAVGKVRWGCQEALTLIGQIADSPSGESQFGDFAVDAANGRLYLTYGSSVSGYNGIARYTWPGLVNVDGSGGRWFTGTDTWGVTCDPSGNVYYNDAMTQVIYKVTPGGTRTTWKTGVGNHLLSLSWASATTDHATGTTGDAIYAADTTASSGLTSGQIMRYWDTAGHTDGALPVGGGTTEKATRVAVLPNGELYWLDLTGSVLSLMRYRPVTDVVNTIWNTFPHDSVNEVLARCDNTVSFLAVSGGTAWRGYTTPFAADTNLSGLTNMRSYSIGSSLTGYVCVYPNLSGDPATFYELSCCP